MYRSSAAMLYELCGEAWAQHAIFPDENALVQHFLTETKLPADPRLVVQMSLMTNSWRTIWHDRLQPLNREEFASLCSVAGAEHLRAAQASGRGIVWAHAHTVFSWMFWNWLSYAGVSQGVTIMRKAMERERDDPPLRALETARELHSAVEALRRGGLAHFVADGSQGNRYIVIPFYNRQRAFRTTFAELALSTNALILPVDVSLASDGQFFIDIAPPLIESPPTLDTAERSESLVRQYVEHLRHRWRLHPSDVAWHEMKRHLRLPKHVPFVDMRA